MDLSRSEINSQYSTVLNGQPCVISLVHDIASMLARAKQLIIDRREIGESPPSIAEWLFGQDNPTPFRATNRLNITNPFPTMDRLLSLTTAEATNG